MPRSTARLRVVPAEQASDPRQPEDLLAFYFNREAALRQELADVEQRIAEQRGRYARKHGLSVHPRVERLRAMFGPIRQGDVK